MPERGNTGIMGGMFPYCGITPNLEGTGSKPDPDQSNDKPRHQEKSTSREKISQPPAPSFLIP